jgi:ketosteroid isomerase-like protein
MKAGPETLEWVMSYYKAVDADDVDTMMQYFTPDARLRFGNGEFIVGSDAIRETLVGMAAGFRSLTHHFNNVWEAEDGVLVLDADAEFVRLDGATVVANGCAIFRHRGRQWTEQLHYADVSGVFT